VGAERLRVWSSGLLLELADAVIGYELLKDNLTVRRSVNPAEHLAYTLRALGISI